jgi:hypothetical protein
MPRKRPDNGDADSSQAQYRQDLPQDDLVNALVPDPSKVPDLIVLVGFLGRSSQNGHWRLYLKPSMALYVEFDVRDVVHHQRIPLEQSYMGMGGTQIWLKGEAQLRLTDLDAEREEAAWLRGSLIDRVSAEPQSYPSDWDLEELASKRPLTTRWCAGRQQWPMTTRWCYGPMTTRWCRPLDPPIEE